MIQDCSLSFIALSNRAQIQICHKYRYNYKYGTNTNTNTAQVQIQIHYRYLGDPEFLLVLHHIGQYGTSDEDLPKKMSYDLVKILIMMMMTMIAMELMIDNFKRHRQHHHVFSSGRIFNSTMDFDSDEIMILIMLMSTITLIMVK